MIYEIKVLAGFNAAHRLVEYQGKCENLHGHNWKVEVVISSRQLDKCGMVMDFRRLKDELNSVLDRLDHTYLNDLPDFKKTNPTSENIASYIYSKLNQLIKEKRVRLKEVSVWETETSLARYVA